MRNVESLTDFLLQSVISDDRVKTLSVSDLLSKNVPGTKANQTISLMDYRINYVASTPMYTLLHTPPPTGSGEQQYNLPDIDIKKMTSVGVAMAMLILAAMQNEIMLDTQMEAIQGTQNQKLSASNTTVLKIRQQIRRKRFKTGFQKFMTWLNSTNVMKFLNSNYGKIIMFAIGAAVTIASFGAAGPAVIAISCLLLATQAAELIIGKSMGELIVQSIGIDDPQVRMAVQMAIDIGLMIADMAVGSAAGASKVAADTADTVADTARLTKTLSDASDQVVDMTKTLEKITAVTDKSDELAKITKASTDATESLEDAVKLSKELSEAVQSGAEASEIAEKTAKLQASMQKASEAMANFQNQVKSVMNNADLADLGEDSAKIMDNLTELNNELSQTTETINRVGNALDNFPDNSKALRNALDGVDDTGGSFSKIKGGIASVGRSLVGLNGLEHLNFIQQIMIAQRRLEQNIQMIMQLNQALYNLSLSQEQALDVEITATIEAIRTRSDARQKFLQMMIDNQLSDMQALMSKVKSAYEQAAEIIREFGETNRMIAQNLVV
ncbi:MAG: hypothetical protein LBB11_00820 [Puniceicoccales bacterium]|jgi:hypothetical protein|nr:hypothetical protein [Puniceicoccales bacterium]